jgi:signal transduction histidine kinase
MTKRLSLRGQMTISYLLVTAAAVLVAEVIILAVVFPQALGEANQLDNVRGVANLFVKDSARRLAAGEQLPTSGEELFHFTDFPTVDKFGKPDAATGKEVPVLPDKPEAISVGDEDGGSAIRIGLVAGGPRPVNEAIGFVLLLDPDGSVRASSYPGRYPRGLAARALPKEATAGLLGTGDGTIATPAGTARWVSMPVIRPIEGRRLPDGGPGLDLRDKVPFGGSPGKPTPDPFADKAALVGKGEVVGAVYVQVPAGAARPSLLGAIGPALEAAGPALAVGLGLLLVTLPVGVVFGLFATRRLTRRIERLAATTARVAEGDLSQRLPVEGADEVSQLERAYNAMADRLGVGIAVERQLAGANARLAERARIARELHDAISQGLFSLGMLSGGLRRALPGGSPLGEQVGAMESTVTRMSQEMRALLLELRPVALEEAGLVPALEELCRAYRTRLGIAVEADLDEVAMPAPAEHAVLRLVQEALANAVRHGDPTTVRVRLAADGGMVVVEVSDDGCGFDPSGGARRGMGLTSMRDRVEELGGTFELLADPGKGTTVRALLPVGSTVAMGDDWAALTWRE